MKAKEKQDKLDEKARLEARKKMEADLFRPAQVQKIAFGTDPKTVSSPLPVNGSWSCS